MTSPYVPPLVQRKRMQLPGFGMEQDPSFYALDNSRVDQALAFGDQTDEIDQAMGLVDRPEPTGLRRFVLPGLTGLAQGLVENYDEESQGGAAFLRGLGSGFLGQQAMARDTEDRNLAREAMAQQLKLRLLGQSMDERRLRLAERAATAPAPSYDPASDVETARERYFRDNGLGVYRPQSAGPGAGPLRLSPGEIAVDPATGRRIASNPRPVDPPSAPTAPVMPGAIVQKVEDNRSRLAVIDQALAELEKQPGSVGLQNYAGQNIMQRVDPQGIALRAAIADIGSMTIHDRSGAAVTVSEFPRLIPFIPLATDSPAKIRQNLLRMKEIIADETARYDARFRAAPDGTPPMLARPQAPAPVQQTGRVSAADRWEQLVDGGMSEAEATAKVRQEYGQ